jgi:hypothetical protein
MPVLIPVAGAGIAICPKVLAPTCWRPQLLDTPVHEGDKRPREMTQPEINVA